VTSAVRPALIPECLAAGHAEPVIVADFLQFSARDRFSRVLSSNSHGHPVYAVDPVTDLVRSGTYVSLDELAAEYADAFLAANTGTGSAVVIGYCAAAALSLRIAELLAERTEVLPILVRPAWPDTDMIRSDFGGMLADLGIADAPVPGLDGDPRLALGRLERILWPGVRALAAERGLDPSGAVVAELVARYRGWLGFLLASRACAERPYGRLSPAVIAGASDVPRVPWLDSGSYRLIRIQLPDDETAAAAELASCSLAQMSARGA
jgi:hypothetical protein